MEAWPYLTLQYARGEGRLPIVPLWLFKRGFRAMLREGPARIVSVERVEP
jgi:hypothetical protein